MIRAASGRCFQADPDQMRIESGMFTGSIYIIFEERDRQTDGETDREIEQNKRWCNVYSTVWQTPLTG